MQITAQREGTYDANVSFSVRYPDDVLDAKSKDPAIGRSEIAMILAAVMSVLFGWFLYYRV